MLTKLLFRYQKMLHPFNYKAFKAYLLIKEKLFKRRLFNFQRNFFISNST